MLALSHALLLLGLLTGLQPIGARSALAVVTTATAPDPTHAKEKRGAFQTAGFISGNPSKSPAGSSALPIHSFILFPPKKKAQTAVLTSSNPG